MTNNAPRHLIQGRTAVNTVVTLAALMAAYSPANSTAFAAQNYNNAAESFADLAQRCAPAIHPRTLSAVVRHESGGKQHAIGINTKGVKLARQPRNLREASVTAQNLLDRGVSFDAGLGQINSRNFKALGLTATSVFDPCTNLQAAATVLADCYDRAAPRHQSAQAALRAALSCYNTGNFSLGFRNGYVAKVAAQAGVKVSLPTPLLQERGDMIEPSLPDGEAIAPAQQAANSDAFGRLIADAFAAKPNKDNDHD